MIFLKHDQSRPLSSKLGYGHQPIACYGASGASPMRKNHTGAPVRSTGISALFDLESSADQQRLQSPGLMFSQLHGLIILDEIQIMPALFNVLRVVVDKPDNQARFLILGSASPHIIKNASETLAGRVEFIDLSGFNLGETNDSRKLLIRGGFPRSFLADSEIDSMVWRDAFIRTFLERDIPMLGITVAPAAMRRYKINACCDQ